MRKYIAIIIVFSLFINCKRGEEEIYIIPENFVGQILVIYNQKDGIKPSYNNGKRVYYIPSNGVLKTQFGENSGWSNFPECYIGNIDNGEKIEVVAYGDNFPNNEKVACCFTSGSVKQTDNIVIKYFKFFIGIEEQIDKAFEESKKTKVLDLINDE